MYIPLLPCYVANANSAVLSDLTDCLAGAVQTAQVLMFMRPEADPPVAFQEYALLAIVAVAAHVGGAFGGDKARGLPALAAHYQHPPDQLEQVCGSSSFVAFPWNGLRMQNSASAAPAPASCHRVRMFRQLQCMP